MGRWEPGTEKRLQQAALDLFSKAGFQQVTVAEIAAAANVSERTFYRYFPTKEDVLFGEGDRLLVEIVAAIRSAPAKSMPADLVGAAVNRLTEIFEPERAKHRLRLSIIQTEPALRERDLLKQSMWAGVIVEELSKRNVSAVRAAALAGAATAGFRAAFTAWSLDRAKTSLKDRVDAVLTQLSTDLRLR